jgi:hypothetical protein
MTRNDVKPITHQRDLANLPPALLPLIERPQWCVWRWTQKPDGKWQKPPFQAKQPDKHASTTDPTTWTDYPTALAAVQAGAADGISYILTKDDPFVSGVFRPQPSLPPAHRRTAAARRSDPWDGARRSLRARRVSKLADRRRSFCKFRRARQ